MDTEDLGFLIVLAIPIFALIGLTCLMSYMTYTQDDFTNQIDVCQHLGNVSTSYSVPHGQTITFHYMRGGGSDDQFVLWLQAMSQHNITEIHLVSKGDWGLMYRGTALYSEYKGVIYLYQ